MADDTIRHEAFVQAPPASTMEVRFEPADGGTRVLLEHRDFVNHGDGADDYRVALASGL